MMASENSTGPFYCNLCNIYCASALNLQSHFLGNKHKAVEEALKSRAINKTLKDSEAAKRPESHPDYQPGKFLGKTLEDQLNSCKDTEPAIGLEYIMEYLSDDNPVYECSLCTSRAGVTNMFMHVLGVKHRLMYLRKHHPKLAEVKGRGTILNKRLKALAASVEKKEGRKSIKSTRDIPIPKDDIYSVQFNDSLITWFAEDDADEGKKKDATKDADATKTKSDSDKSEDKKEAEQSDTQNTELLEDSDSEDFSSNQDLLKYLKSFEIVDEDDVAFVLKMTQKLTAALVTYRYKPPQNKSTEVQPYGYLGGQSEQRTSKGAAEPNIDFSEWELPVEQSFENTKKKSDVKTSIKRKASETNTKPSKDVKTPKLGAFKSTFQEVPDEQDGDSEGPVAAQGTGAASHGTEVPNAASRDLQGPAQGKESPSSLQKQASVPVTPPSLPSESESQVIAKFFSSIRNMDADEVAGTLQKIAESNPTFSGMDVQNVINILTQSGNLKPKNTTSKS